MQPTRTDRSPYKSPTAITRPVDHLTSPPDATWLSTAEMLAKSTTASEIREASRTGVRKANTCIGTMIKPPPTPNRPASSPPPAPIPSTPAGAAGANAVPESLATGGSDGGLAPSGSASAVCCGSAGRTRNCSSPIATRSKTAKAISSALTGS